MCNENGGVVDDLIVYKVRDLSLIHISKNEASRTIDKILAQYGKIPEKEKF